MEEKNSKKKVPGLAIIMGMGGPKGRADHDDEHGEPEDDELEGSDGEHEEHDEEAPTAEEHKAHIHSALVEASKGLHRGDHEHFAKSMHAAMELHKHSPDEEDETDGDHERDGYSEGRDGEGHESEGLRL
jgi:hypothetical protein